MDPNEFKQTPLWSAPPPNAASGPAPRPISYQATTPTPAAAPPKSGGLMKPLGIGLVAGALLVGVPVGGIAGGLAGGYAVSQFAGNRSAPVAQVAPSQPAPPIVLPGSTSGATDLSRLYEQVVKSVVQVNAQSSRGAGIGSGFVVDRNGHILTNNHVVQGATRITVRFQNGGDIPATVLGRDPSGDLAVLKITLPEGVSPLALADSDQVKPGEAAIAIGSPEGLTYSITSGIVSGVERTAGAGGSRPLSGLIQTDAAINPGNSGGPLLNARGEVIGINTLGSQGVQNIGFAVPINSFKRIQTRLLAGEVVQHAWLGISSSADQSSAGVPVADVTAGSPASGAGLRSGDVITSIEGKQVKTVEELRKVLDEQKPGAKVMIEFTRNGQKQSASATLQAWPEQLRNG